MDNPNEFQMLLRQIMSRECNPILSKEDIDLSIREMDVFQLVGGEVFGVVELKKIKLLENNKLAHSKDLPMVKEASQTN